jgi:hypothetical protein
MALHSYFTLNWLFFFFFFIIVLHSLAFYLKSFPTQVLQELIELNQETRTRILFYPNKKQEQEQEQEPEPEPEPEQI